MINKKLRSAIPGLLPLAVLIIAEMIWGITIGLIAAAFLGITELAYHLIKNGKFEKAILPELGMLMFFGVFAITLKGEVLEQLMTVFIVALLLIMTGISAFSGHNLLMASAGRYFKGVKMGPWELYQMQKTIQIMFWFLLGYLVLFIAAFFLAPPFVAFMGGTGLLILFGTFFIIEIIRKRLTNKKLSHQEWLPLVEENGNVIGNAPRYAVHHPKRRWLHPVVHLQVMGNNGLWLQKRPMHKLVQPGKWDTAVGGHLSAGEPVELSLQREANEEIGLTISNPAFLGKYIWECDLERELVFAFAQKHEGPLTPNPEELDDGRFWTFQEIESQLGAQVFTPNFEHEYRLFKTILKRTLVS